MGETLQLAATAPIDRADVLFDQLITAQFRMHKQLTLLFLVASIMEITITTNPCFCHQWVVLLLQLTVLEVQVGRANHCPLRLIQNVTF